MDNKITLIKPETLAALTHITVPEIEILRENGIFWMRYDSESESFLYDKEEMLEVVKSFDKLIVTRDGLDPNLGYKISWPEFDALYPGEGQIKPVGYDWPTGRALFRFSDVLNWRKIHGFDVLGKGLSNVRL